MAAGGAVRTVAMGVADWNLSEDERTILYGAEPSGRVGNLYCVSLEGGKPVLVAKSVSRGQTRFSQSPTASKSALGGLASLLALYGASNAFAKISGEPNGHGIAQLADMVNPVATKAPRVRERL
jgi:hypothetical protein